MRARAPRGGPEIARVAFAGAGALVVSSLVQPRHYGGQMVAPVRVLPSLLSGVGSLPPCGGHAVVVLIPLAPPSPSSAHGPPLSQGVVQTLRVSTGHVVHHEVGNVTVLARAVMILARVRFLHRRGRIPLATTVLVLLPIPTLAVPRVMTEQHGRLPQVVKRVPKVPLPQMVNRLRSWLLLGGVLPVASPCVLMRTFRGRYWRASSPRDEKETS